MIDIETAARRPLYRAARIPARFKGVQLRDMELDGYDESVMRTVRAFIRDVRDGKVIGSTGRGLLLMGEPGHGKTMLACAVANEVLLRTPIDALRTNPTYLPQRPVYFTSWSALLTLRQELMRNDDASDEWAQKTLTLEGAWGTAFDPASVVRLLVLDDVGREHTTRSGWAEHTLADLLRTRFDLGLPTVITTNLLIAGADMDWEHLYGEGTASIVGEAYNVLPLDNRQGSMRPSALIE